MFFKIRVTGLSFEVPELLKFLKGLPGVEVLRVSDPVPNDGEAGVRVFVDLRVERPVVRGRQLRLPGCEDARGR